MPIRQPIVTVLGHVDHGKTTLLDRIRGTAVAAREAGAITQHIGATEVPISVIHEICREMTRDKKFAVPGLLFIDTPGHHSFKGMRTRGGTLADLAVLVIDINEGVKPQTEEAISVLRRCGTQFVIVLNKIDLTPGWRRKEGICCLEKALERQTEEVRGLIEERTYQIIGRLHDLGVNADRYQVITDFKKTAAIVPLSAKSGEGLPDLLLVLIGIAQCFLDESLTVEETCPGEGTILEVKEERGLGPTLDVILYKGTLRIGDTIAIGTLGEPKVTRVRAILKPKPLDEIRDPRERFVPRSEVSAAAGIKVVGQEISGAVAGALLLVVAGDMGAALSRISTTSKACVSMSEDGILVKADALGSLEAISYEAERAGIPIRKAEVGDISRREVVDVAACKEREHRVVLGFNVEILPDAREEMESQDVAIITGKIIYRLIEDYQRWRDDAKAMQEKDLRDEIVYPGKALLLPDCVFRVSKPAIVGVRIIAGRLRPGQRLIRQDGKPVGRIKSMRSGDTSLKEAPAGAEVALAIEGPTVGRQINVGDVVFVEIPEEHVRRLEDTHLTLDERDVLSELCRIKREEKKFWGK